MRKKIFIISFLIIAIQACAPSAHVVSNKICQKRKYNKGWNIKLIIYSRGLKTKTNELQKKDISLTKIPDKTLYSKKLQTIELDSLTPPLQKYKAEKKINFKSSNIQDSSLSLNYNQTDFTPRKISKTTITQPDLNLEIEQKIEKKNNEPSPELINFRKTQKLIFILILVTIFSLMLSPILIMLITPLLGYEAWVIALAFLVPIECFISAQIFSFIQITKNAKEVNLEEKDSKFERQNLFNILFFFLIGGVGIMISSIILWLFLAWS
jgi:hypothetical protein